MFMASILRAQHTFGLSETHCPCSHSEGGTVHLRLIHFSCSFPTTTSNENGAFSQCLALRSRSPYRACKAALLHITYMYVADLILTGCHLAIAVALFK